jgi:hypothetical protein
MKCVKEKVANIMALHIFFSFFKEFKFHFYIRVWNVKRNISAKIALNEEKCCIWGCKRVKEKSGKYQGLFTFFKIFFKNNNLLLIFMYGM